MAPDLDSILGAISARLREVDAELERVAALKAERTKLRRAHTALLKAFGQAPARAPRDTSTTPAAGRQARPPQAGARRPTTRVTQAHVLAALSSAPVTAGALGLRLQLSRQTVLYHLNRLRTTGTVTTQGQGSATTWRRT